MGNVAVVCRFYAFVEMGVVTMAEYQMNKLGFGCLRLPHINPEDECDFDDDKLNQLVDAFLAKGGTFFDTAYTYQDGGSEAALKRCLTSRYPRDAYRLCTKMPSYVKDKAAD